jgi:hypothetical protein
MLAAAAQAHPTGSEITRFSYVGDGVWDLRAAQNLGWEFIGIADGQGAQELRRLGAQHVLPHFHPTSGIPSDPGVGQPAQLRSSNHDRADRVRPLKRFVRDRSFRGHRRQRPLVKRPGGMIDPRRTARKPCVCWQERYCKAMSENPLSVSV